LATLKRNLVKQEENIKRIVSQFQKKVFISKEEILLRIEIIKDKFKCYLFEKKIRGYYKRQKGLKRKILVGFQVEISYKKNEDAIKKMENKKGKFILATNILDDGKLSAREILEAYRCQNKNIESCFKFMKNKTYKLSTISQTKPNRIEAMLPVISLILLLNNLGKMDLQEELARKNSTIPNQIGKEIKNPTLKWAFQLFRKVARVRMELSGKIIMQFKEIGEVQKLIIEAFGSYAKE
jgi:transposase